MKRLGFVLAFLFISTFSFAQISGTTPVTPGQSVTYTYVGSSIYGYYYWSISPSYGSIQSQSSSGTTYYVTILWNSTGTCTLSFSGYGQLLATKSITINCPTVSTPSSTFTYSSNSCGAKTITRNSNPPANINWYWQTSSTGTDMTYSGNTYTASATGVYYLRAKIACSSWSSALATSTVTINATPPNPAAPTTTSNSCGPQTLSFNGSPPGGVTWYWQDHNSSGTNTSNSSSTYSATTTGYNTYYLRAYANGCWSNSVSVSTTVSTAAQQPGATLTVSSNSCGTKTVTISGTRPTNETWHWQGTNPSGTSINPNTTQYATETGTYYLRSLYNPSGCWSTTSQYIYITVSPTPPDPATPTSTSNSCGPQTLSFNGSPPGGVTWYWQDTNQNGTSTSNSSSTYSATSVGNYTYYLRAFTGVCWSNSVSVNTTVAPVAQTPYATLTVSGNICGSKTVTISGTPPANEVWHWQGTTSNGTSINSNTTQPIYSSGTYYLRSLYVSSGCWSNSSQSVSVTINDIPSVPATPTTTSNSCGPQTLSFNGSPPGGVTWYWQNNDPNGISTSNSSSTYPATAIGNNTYYLRAYNGICWSNAVGVSSTVAPVAQTPYATLTVSTNTCGSKTVNISGTPPANEVWHWQGLDNPNGTTINSNTTQTITTSGTYYLRSLYMTSGCWSTYSQYVIVTINDPPAPNAPTTTTYSCGPQTLSKNGTAPGGVTWYWQGLNNPNGMDYTTPQATGANYSAASSGTYYLRARNTLGCWSASVSVVVSVNVIPAAPIVPSVSGTCDAKTLTRANPADGSTWYWQGTTSNGTSTGNSAATYSAPGTNTYYIRALAANGCWSTQTSVAVTIVPTPAPPLSPVTDINTCGSKTLTKPTAPTGVSYYWQGENSNSFDYTSPSAIASTYEAYSSTTYYIKAKADAANCWSANTPINIAVNPVTIMVSSYDERNPIIQATSSIRLLPGFVVPAGKPLQAKIVISAECNDLVNWTEQTVFDAAGAPISMSRTYSDGFGNPLESQTKDYLNNKVFGSQSMFNLYGVPVASSLAAPILETDFIYKSNLISNAAGATYGANDFDLRTVSPGGVTNPNPVGTQPGTVGWYYSNANTLEPKTPTTQFPYSRSYALEGPDPTVTQSAGPGDQHRMGSGHETKSEKLLITANELNHYYSLRVHFPNANQTNPTNLGYKYISTDPNGKRAVSFADADGHSLASATITSAGGPPFTYANWSYTYYNDIGQVVASVAPNGVNTASTALPGFVTYFKYDHLGRMIETTSIDEGTSRFVYALDGRIRFSENQVQRTATPKRFSYTNYDNLGRLIESGEYTGSGTNPFLFEPHSTATPASNSVLNIIEQLGFSGVTRVLDPTRCKDHSFIQYDTPAKAFEANQAPSPECDNLTGYGSYSGLSALSLVTQNNETYIRTRCNQAGTGPGMWTTAAIPVVAGEKYRFIVKGYSLINLAYLFLEYNGEPVTYGPTLPIGANLEGAAVFEFTVPAGKTIMKYGVRWGGAQLNEDFFVNYISMQKATVLGTSQYNLYGQISKTENENATTWYSYDEFGQLEWMKQNIVGLGVKTIDYTYDYFGNVTQVAYQAGQPDKFYHHYVYDLNQRLTEVYTSLDGTNKTLHAKYLYYLHGPLKRVELANNLQGIDYVYTINGALKSINHSDVAKDPGNDGSNGFSQDVFGQLMDYYDNDYTGAGYSTGSLTVSGLTNQFNGAIRDISWFTPVDKPSTKKIYGYTYDHLYQLQNAQFGTVSGTAGTYSAELTDSYNENIPAYDKNGNIQSLIRKNKAGTNIGNYAYNYVANTNKVNTITNGGAAMMSYAYNTIGQMTQQTESGNTLNVTYNAYGLTKEVRNTSNQLLVSYGYDDRGDRVKKLSYNAGTLVKTTYYVQDAAGNTLAIYEQPNGSAVALAEVPIYGAGRLGLYKPVTTSTFYEINDHLGNVRAVIGPPKTDIYTATMETETAVAEDGLFNNSIAPRIVSTAANNTPGGNEVVRINNGQINGGYPGRITGPGIKLKVAPGDVITAEVWGYHEGGSGYSNTLPTASIVTAVASLFGGVSGAVGDPGKTYSAFNQTYTGGSFPGAAGSGNDNIPAGYLNLIMFNNDLLTASELPMAAIPITAGAATKQKLTIGPIDIPAPGYVYIYVNNNSNSPNWVYFDDLKVTHVRSPFVSGADYYPFGLTMSDREITAEPYRFGYQGQFAEEETETGWNSFDSRMYDPRFGKWQSTDPEGQFSSPYVGMGNNPISAIDIDGKYIYLLGGGKLSLFKFLTKMYSTPYGRAMISQVLDNPAHHLIVKYGNIVDSGNKVTHGVTFSTEDIENSISQNLTINIQSPTGQVHHAGIFNGETIDADPSEFWQNTTRVDFIAIDPSKHSSDLEYLDTFGHEIGAHGIASMTLSQQSINQKVTLEEQQHQLWGTDTQLDFNNLNLSTPAGIYGSQIRAAQLTSLSLALIGNRVFNISTMFGRVPKPIIRTPRFRH